MNDSIKNIISLLPQYNTSSVFVFDNFGEIIFKNEIADDTFENINKINFKKLSIKLKCSDKTAKKIIEKHAPYLLDIE